MFSNIGSQTNFSISSFFIESIYEKEQIYEQNID